MYIRPRTLLILSLVTAQAACSSGGSDGGTNLPNDDGVGQPNVIDVAMAPAGDITHYGAVTIGDDVGEASDLVGSFYRLDTGVSSSFMQTMLSGSSTMCQVQDDGVIDFEEISAGYLPTVPGQDSGQRRGFDRAEHSDWHLCHPSGTARSRLSVLRPARQSHVDGGAHS